MIITIVNTLTCVAGLFLGLYVFIRHLNGMNDNKTNTVDAWLVAVGSLAWSVGLFAVIDGALERQSLYSHDIGLTGAEAFAHVLMLIFWVGVLLQIKQYCLKIKLRKRKLERAKLERVKLGAKT